MPEFPEFKDVDLSCQKIIKDFLARYPLEASEYTFTNIFAFRFTYNFKISILKNNLLILKGTAPFSMFCPLGNSQIPEVLQKAFDFLRNYRSELTDMTDPYFERIPGSFVNADLYGSKNYIIKEDRAQFDYVHDVKELIELRGKKFHDKRNHVNKFRSHYKYEYITLTQDLIGECLEFEDYWCEVKECEKHPALEKERCAVLQMLNNFKALNIKGGAIRTGGKIAAVTLGEKILPDTLVIHVEKATPEIPGVYQIINQEFLMHEAGDCRFVNREQDLGVEGLRKAKMSYNPVRFVKKYKIYEKPLPHPPPSRGRGTIHSPLP